MNTLIKLFPISKSLSLFLEAVKLSKGEKQK